MTDDLIDRAIAAGLVKPLEWEFDESCSMYRSDSPLGPYAAWEISGTSCHMFPGGYLGTIAGKTLAEAQTAALRDYARRILSALDPEVLERMLGAEKIIEDIAGVCLEPDHNASAQFDAIMELVTSHT